jgi:hypothetical protein
MFLFMEFATVPFQMTGYERKDTVPQGVLAGIPALSFCVEGKSERQKPPAWRHVCQMYL